MKTTNSGRERLYEREVPVTMAETEIVDRQSELAKVQSWRLHVLIEAGFPLPLAEKIAASEADLHRAVELLRQGCEPQTAAEILL